MITFTNLKETSAQQRDKLDKMTEQKAREPAYFSANPLSMLNFIVILLRNNQKDK